MSYVGKCGVCLFFRGHKMVNKEERKGCLDEK